MICDIFNCDEAALFLNKTSNNTCAHDSFGKKLLKNRVSILRICKKCYLLPLKIFSLMWRNIVIVNA